MINLLKQLKEEMQDKGYICEIENDVEIYPNVLIQPISETITFDNLGNAKSKKIEFYFSVFKDKSDYENDVVVVGEVVNIAFNILKEKDILNIERCNINFEEIKEQLLVAAKARFTINLYKWR